MEGWKIGRRWTGFDDCREDSTRGIVLLRKGITVVIPYTGGEEGNSDAQEKTGD